MKIILFQNKQVFLLDTQQSRPFTKVVIVVFFHLVELS